MNRTRFNRCPQCGGSNIQTRRLLFRICDYRDGEKLAEKVKTYSDKRLQFVKCQTCGYKENDLKKNRFNGKSKPVQR